MTYAAERAAISRAPVILVTLSLDFCTRTFGTAPCNATGTPCYNTYPTCTFRSAYQITTKDYKFATRGAPNPLPGQIVRPYLEESRYLPQEIVPDEALTLNQSLMLVMADEPDGDIGIDPYRVSPTLRSAPGGSSATAAQGNFWTKLKSRNSNYKNRRVTVKRGFTGAGLAEGDFLTYFTGVLDNIEIDSDGRARLTLKGLLQLTDVDLPKKTDGRLSAAITSGATSFTLAAWTGIDRSSVPAATQYQAAGYIKIDTEILQYTGRSLDTATGITTFTGVTRGLYNPDGWDQAAAHDADAMVQQVEVYEGNPIDLIKSLLNAAGIVDADIDTTGFAAERDDWFPGITFRGILHEPKKIKEYLQELREETLTSLWQGDDQKIKLKFLGPNRPGQSYRLVTDAANIVFQSRKSNDQQPLRITRASFYYDLFAGKSGSETDHFARAAVVIDAAAESVNEYNEIKARKPILSRWIRHTLTGDDYSRIIAARIVRRFRDGSRLITFEVDLKDETLAVGEVFELATSFLVDFNGAAETIRFQVTKKEQVSPGKLRYTALDTRLVGRFAFIAPNGTPDYASATAAQREYAFIADTTTEKMPNGDPPYLII